MLKSPGKEKLDVKPTFSSQTESSGGDKTSIHARAGARAGGGHTHTYTPLFSVTANFMAARLLFSLENLLDGVNRVIHLDEAGGFEWTQALCEFS